MTDLKLALKDIVKSTMKTDSIKTVMSDEFPHIDYEYNLPDEFNNFTATVKIRGHKRVGQTCEDIKQSLKNRVTALCKIIVIEF